VTLSLRAKKVLVAISLLPEGRDGWRRATYRDQLHEGVPSLSRGAVARSFASGELAGLVVTQGVGQSARLPEGYKLTDEGARLAREAGPIQPDPVTRSSTDPVFGSGLSLGSKGDRKEPEPKTERPDPVRSSAADPVPTFALAPHSLAVLYAAMTQTPLCGCMLPMHADQQRKTGLWFWRCMHGRKGCGLTTSMRYQPKGSTNGRGVRTIGDDEARRRGDFSGLTGTAWLALNAASKAPPTTQTSPHQRATTTMRDERTA
jgi:hypothetical protein